MIYFLIGAGIIVVGLCIHSVFSKPISETLVSKVNKKSFGGFLEEDHDPLYEPWPRITQLGSPIGHTPAGIDGLLPGDPLYDDEDD